jgi:hypothetical protein
MPYKGRNLDSTSRTFFTNVSSISNGGHQRRESTDPSEPRSEGSASSRTAVKFSATEHLDLEAIDLRDQTDDSALEGLYICFRDKATVKSPNQSASTNE